MRGVVAPVIHDVENLGANNSAQNHKNSKMPCMLRIDALLLGIAHADPEPDQHSQGHQETVSWKTKVAYVKKSRKHYLVRCVKPGFATTSLTDCGRLPVVGKAELDWPTTYGKNQR